MKFMETQGKSLEIIRKEMKDAFKFGDDILARYSCYQNEISSDIKLLEETLKRNGVKTPYSMDIFEDVLEWKFYKPVKAKSGRFRLNYNGIPLLENPFEFREYVHPYLASFYMNLMNKLDSDIQRSIKTGV